MIFSPRGSDGERPGPQSQARPGSSAAVGAASVRDARVGALWRLPVTPSGQRRRPAADAPDRRAVHALAVPGLAPDGGDAARRLCRDQPQAGSAADAADGDCGAGPEAADQQTGPGAHNLPVSASGGDGRAAEPSLGGAAQGSVGAADGMAAEGADITYIPIGRGFRYLVAVMEWSSRAVLTWRLSNPMDVSFCVSALEEALARF